MSEQRPPETTTEPRPTTDRDLVPVATTIVPASSATVIAPMGASLGRRPRWLNPVAAILIAYGAAGVLLSIVLLVLGLQVWPLIQVLMNQIAATLHATAVTLGTAAVAAGGAGASLDQVQQVTSAASQTVLQASNNLRQLAQAMDIQVLGARPFGDLTPRFSDTADNLQQLGTSLAGTSQALGQNSTQSGAMQTNLLTTQQQLAQLADTLDTGFGGVGLPVVVLAAVIWVLVMAQALLTLFAGVLLLWKTEWWTTP
jgi:hypothetical protein